MHGLSYNCNLHGALAIHIAKSSRVTKYSALIARHREKQQVTDKCDRICKKVRPFPHILHASTSETTPYSLAILIN